MENSSPTLHVCNTNTFKHFITVNKCHGFIHLVAIAFLLSYRCSYLFQDDSQTRATPIIPWLLIFTAELLLSFQWLLTLGSRWRPVSRTVFPERLPSDDKLPAVDVFIFTADPKKEATAEVMNTVISAMALDYPSDKLHVYLSDDGGAAVTLHGMREAWKFARYWLPFCNKFGIKTICPKAYFSTTADDCDHSWNSDFISERDKIKVLYDKFKERIEKAAEDGDVSSGRSREHFPVVEVINKYCDVDVQEEDQVTLPLLVYVSREKRPSHPHNFKAGAINVLLRVSGLLSNSPYILSLDCDMYCNDPSSARQAMCFYLDPKISTSLAFVQFPQMFDNVSKNDIYDCAIRYIFVLIWYGLDGLQGPILSGTNFYIKRKALYDKYYIQEDMNIKDLKNSFGHSNEFIKSLRSDHKPSSILLLKDDNMSSTLLQETKVLSSCTYESHTEWGKSVGFRYNSVIEDMFTGYKAIQCQGWRSVYLNPKRPQFLGTTTTTLNDLIIQGTRWSAGLSQVGLSRFSPLIYGVTKLSFLQSMSYADFTFYPLTYSLALYCFAIIPQLCLFYGIPLYPKVSNPFSFVFLFVFLSAHLKHLFEVIYTGGSVQMMIHEQRMWMIRSVTAHLYGSLTAISEKLGIGKIDFLPTNKIIDDEQVKRYQMGVFDFQTATIFLAPMGTIIFLNMASLFNGLARIVLTGGGFDQVLIQLLLSCYILVMNYPIIEGMFIRKDKARIQPSVTILSAIISIIFLCLGGYIILIHN